MLRESVSTAIELCGRFFVVIDAILILTTRYFPGFVMSLENSYFMYFGGFNRWDFVSNVFN